MNKEYKIKLDLNKKLYNKKMAFNQFDENVNDFYIEVTKNNEVVKDLDKSIITLVTIKPNNAVDAQFIEVKEGQIYADLKPSMCDLVGNYQAKAMIVLEGEIVTTDTIIYSVSEDKIISRLNDDIVSDERFALFTDALARLSTIEISEEQRVINEAERILSEENRKIEEAKRVEAELIRQHEEADRAKYDATRESNENIRKINEEARISSENVRLENEANRIEQEANRVKAEQLRKDNYNLMTKDEERRRSEANAHREAEVLRVQAENTRVNEEAKRRTTEQARVSAENTRVSNENTRKANETTRQTNETHRVEAETQRQNRYNSFILEAEANANNFENYTNAAKVNEGERKSNELNRKSQEDRRVSNEVERISNENTRKANEVAREKNETSRQYVFENKVNEVDKKIVELNTTKDNFVSNINTKVDTKISEIEVAKSDMTNTVSNKINEVETRFNALTSSQQQDAEVIDARDGETSLKSRLDRDIEKAKQVYVNVEGSHISTDSNVGYLKDVEILGNTIQSASNLADIRSVGDKIEGQELYEIPVLSVGKNLFNGIIEMGDISATGEEVASKTATRTSFIRIKKGINYVVSGNRINSSSWTKIMHYDINKKFIATKYSVDSTVDGFIRVVKHNPNQEQWNFQIEEGTVATPYEPYVEDKLTILSPTPLEKVGDVADRIIEKDGIWGVEKNVYTATSDCFLQDSKKQLWHLSKSKVPSWISKNIWNEISNMVMCNYYGEVATYNEVLVTEGIFIDHKGTSPNIIIGTNDTNINSLPSDLITKYQLTTPQFIPLPHDQQIKLRTFANKTNISFLTEIEGTIKAQVPKSLGSSINTHTEQINNLNKELDRVKKLEESTVSTVTTESDFTTVEATSNGYFEDVKLEGRTLVNLCTHLYDQKHNSVIDKGSALNYTKHPHYTQCDFKLLQNLKQNTTYTVVLNVTNFVEGMSLQVNFYKYDEWIVCSNIEYVRNKGVHTVLLTTNENIADHIRIGKMNDEVENLDEYTTLSKDIIILEGDHTQNPPNGYIEGLKSVGQDVDEVSVLSVNEREYIDGSIVNDVWHFKEPISSGYFLNTSDKIIGLSIINSNNIWLESKNINPNECFDVSNKLNYGEKVSQILFSSDVGWTFTPNPNLTNYIIFNKDMKQDKKRLLYYNNETQAWEKPILRQWDSIEKHADGKYYYHQRSGEVVLNGSENWNNDKNSSTISPETYRQSIQFNAIDIPSASFNMKTSPNIISDLLPTVIFGDVYSYNHIGISISGTDSIGTHIIINNNFTDVTELKQWLQANNLTVVYELAQEKVYECTNIDLITYANETNYIVECGAISPKTTLKVHNNISNVVSLLQKKVSLLESDITSYMITQNRLMLASRYNADNVTFKADYPSMMSEREVEIDYDLFKLIQDNIIVGPKNYDVDKMLEIMDLYAMIGFITWEMWDYLYEVIYSQINPVIEDLEGTPEI